MLSLPRLFILSLLPVPFLSLPAADLSLIDGGRSDYQIVVPDNLPSPALTECLNQTTRLVQVAFQANGAEVAVVVESKRSATKPTLYLGNTSFAQKNNVDTSKLIDWSYVQRVVGKDLIIAGTRSSPFPSKRSPLTHPRKAPRGRATSPAIITCRMTRWIAPSGHRA